MKNGQLEKIIDSYNPSWFFIHPTLGSLFSATNGIDRFTVPYDKYAFKSESPRGGTITYDVVKATDETVDKVIMIIPGVNAYI